MSTLFLNMIFNYIFLAAFSTGEWIAIAALFASIIGPLFVLIFKSGGLYERIDHIKNSIQDIKPDVKSIPIINERVTILWADRFTVSNSPMILNDRGIKILKESNIEALTNEYYTEILKQVKELNPQNAYQAQENLIEVIKNLKTVDNCKNKLEEAAFITGVDVDTVLLVAAINIRDKVIKDLKFEIGDIDKFAPSNTK
jgi:hypothetical protein